jgi:hypothetical protein
MRTTLLTVFAAVCLFGLPAAAESDLEIVVDVLPGTLLISDDLDSFEVRRPTVEDEFVIVDAEETSLVSIVPNVKVGIGLEFDDVYVTPSVGTGLVLNTRFRSWMFRADLAADWRFGRTGTIGPHIGAIWLTDTDWFGDGRVDFSSDGGFLFGGHITIGHDIVFVFSLDVIDAAMDVTTSDDWVANDTNVDLSGLMLNFGVRGRF